MVYEKPNHILDQPVSIRNLPDGTYILRITGHGKGFSKLIRKQ